MLPATQVCAAPSQDGVAGPRRAGGNLADRHLLLRQLRGRHDRPHRQECALRLLCLFDQCMAGRNRLQGPGDPDGQAGRPHCQPHRGTPAGPERLEDVLSSVLDRRHEQSGGGYRRDQLRALPQSVECGESEVRIMGSKSTLLKTPVPQGGKSAAIGVPNRGLKWRRGCPLQKQINILIY